jgi:hypothetical protein
MTPDQTLEYINRNRQYLNMSGILRDAGISPAQFSDHMAGWKVARGYKSKISIEKLWALAEVVKKLKDG